VQGLDGPFARSVLEGYHLLGVAAEAPRPALPPGQAPGDVTDEMIKGGFAKALPFWIAGLVLMYVVLRWMVRGSAASPSATGTVQGDAVAPLPEELRVVRVPGLRYPVAHLAGLVTDKESEVRTEFATRTTAERDPYALGPNAAINLRTTTSSTSTRIDTLWVRRPDGSEASWRLTGSGLQARPGHILSVIARPLRNGDLQFVLAYNHATGQQEMLTYEAHRVRVLAPWFVATVLGAVPGAMGIATFLSIVPKDDPEPLYILVLTYLIMGGIGAGFVGVFMAIWQMGASMRARNAAFAQRYVPAFVAFFRQVSPRLRQQFGSP
jgi:hypothetical protein